MKKLLLLALLFTACNSCLTAQDTVYLKREAKKKLFTDRAPQTAFAEIGGPGLAFSVNYDKRFKNEIGGWGWRAGIGYSFINTFKFTTIPFGINYLAGDKSKGRFFEAGLNGTLLFAGNYNQNSYYVTNSIGDTYIPSNSTTFITSATLGYRSQPLTGGFSFRGGLTPYLIKGDAQIGGYISFGYSF